MKIKEIFENEKLCRDFIEIKFEGPYWMKCRSFIERNWHYNVDQLTIKQQEWFEKILEDCVEMRILSQ